MPMQYSDEFIDEVLTSYDLIKEGDKSEFSTIGALREHYGISKDTLSRWVKARKEIEPEPEPEVLHFEVAPEISPMKHQQDLIDEIQAELVEMKFASLNLKTQLDRVKAENLVLKSEAKESENVKLGNTFWMFLSQNLGLPSRTTVSQMKFNIGRKLIKESGLIEVSKPIKKARISDDFFSEV